jgi:hypothetical protein
LAGRIQVLTHWQLEIKADVQKLLDESQDREKLREMIADHPNSNLISDVHVSVLERVPQSVKLRFSGLNEPVFIHRQG